MTHDIGFKCLYLVFCSVRSLEITHISCNISPIEVLKILLAKRFDSYTAIFISGVSNRQQAHMTLYIHTKEQLLGNNSKIQKAILTAQKQSLQLQNMMFTANSRHGS